MLLSGVSRALEHEPRALMSAQKDSLEGGRFAASVRANKEVYGSEPCNTALFDPSIISDCDGPQHCQMITQSSASPAGSGSGPPSPEIEPSLGSEPGHSRVTRRCYVILW